MDEMREETLCGTRRRLLLNSANSVGMLALASLLKQDGLLAASPAEDPGASTGHTDPLLPRAPHFAPKAKSCIFIYLEGAPSQIDLFDQKPKLRELSGEKLPDSFTE